MPDGHDGQDPFYCSCRSAVIHLAKKETHLSQWQRFFCAADGMMSVVRNGRVAGEVLIVRLFQKEPVQPFGEQCQNRDSPSERRPQVF